MNFPRLLLVVFFIGLWVDVLGQSSPNQFPVYDSKTMLPTSPEAAMLGRFGDVPIGYYTGTADVSVPLYTIKEAGLEIPIVLRYHNSGVRVGDQATNVGLGWSLEPEGSIIQIVNGTEDHDDQIVTADTAGYNFLVSRRLLGVYSATHDIGTNDWACSLPYNAPEDSWATLQRLLAGDGQPDIYSYSFGGHSGKFYINFETGQPVQLDQRDPITFSNAGTPYNWTATTREGDIYYFNNIESSTTYLVSQHTGYTYKLTQVVLHTGKTIQFQYANGYYTWFTYSERYHTPYPYNLNPQAEAGMQPIMDFPKFNTQNLTRIISSEVQVNFNLEDRTDLIGEADIDTIPNNGSLSTKRIRSVDILSTVTGQKIKSFRFYYSYFPYSTVGGSYVTDTVGNTVLGSRLRLDSLQETGYSANGDSMSKPCYKFAYDSTNLLPMKTSFAQDFWGYYNGQNNTGMLPNMSFFYYNIDSNYLFIPTGLMDSLFTNERAPDSTKMTAGMLKRITYPTGGYTEFDYTPNTFTNHYYPDIAKEAATLKQMSIKDINIRSYPDTSFTLNRTTRIAFNAQISSGTPLQGLHFSDMQSSFIEFEEFIPPNTANVIKMWQMTAADSNTFNANGGTMTWNQEITVPYDPTPGATYNVIVNLPDQIGQQTTSEKTASVSCNFTFYDTTNNPYRRSIGGGVRVSGIRNYTDSGTLASHKILHYVNADSSSSGVLMSPLVYWYYNVMNYIALLGEDGDQQEFGSATDDSTYFIASDNAVPFSNSAAGNMVGYSRVEEQNVAPDGSTTGWHIYEYENIPDDWAINCPDAPHLNNGLISRETLLDAARDTLQQSLYNYSIQKSASFNGIKIFADYVGVSPCDVTSVNGQEDSTITWPLNDKYTIMYYPVDSYMYLPGQKITRYFGGGQVITDSSFMTWNNLGEQKTLTAYNSKHQKLLTTTSYPIDSTASTNATILYMLNHSMYEYPLQKIASVNDSEIQRQNIAYEQMTDGYPIIAPDSIQLSYNGGPLFTDVAFDGYGYTANVTHFVQRGSPTGMLWNLNNNQVIAQVSNASNFAYAYTSFEPDEQVSWVISDTPRNRSQSITGAQSYTFGASSKITASVPFRQYVVSYWSRNGPISVNTGVSVPAVAGPTRNGWTYYEHTTSSLSSLFTLTGPGVTIDELRLYETTAQMKTYTYLPLVGISSECGVDGRMIYYHYDPLGRLSDIRDQDGNITKTYQYHYKGQ